MKKLETEERKRRRYKSRKDWRIKHKDQLNTKAREVYAKNRVAINEKRRGKQMTETRRQYLEKNKDAIRVKKRLIKLKRKYGLTPEDKQRMLIGQNNKCLICGEMISLEPITACVDHNHKTKKVRGLLCSSCNLGLGFFKDDIIRLQQAIIYLKNKDDI